MHSILALANGTANTDKCQQRNECVREYVGQPRILQIPTGWVSPYGGPCIQYPSENQECVTRRMPLDQFLGLLLFFGHVGCFSNLEQPVQFGGVIAREHAPICGRCIVVAVSHEYFQAEIIPQCDKPSVVSAASPDPGSDDREKNEGSHKGQDR